MADPYNYHSLNRKDLMSLATIDQQKDGFKISAKDFVSKRKETQNLYTLDIEGNQYWIKQLGAQPKLFGSRSVNKITTQNTNLDIDGTISRQLHFGKEIL